MKSALSRRSFLQGSMLVAGTATAGLPLFGSSGRAFARTSLPTRATGPVMISSNEYPVGPTPAALQAIVDVSGSSNRYLRDLRSEFIAEVAAKHGVTTDSVMGYAGSSPALDYTILAFTSPTRSLVTAEVGYEQPWWAAERNGAKIHKIAERVDGSHDVQAMCAADANAGTIYICNPNNPTGSVTLKADLDYALANKPAGSVLVVDEAYIDFSDSATSADYMVAAGEDVVVLRTFSKLYGMAALRLGYALGRPDLIQKLNFFNSNHMPNTAVAAGLVSLRDPALILQRRRENMAILTDTTQWLAARGYTCSKSEANCFMLDVKRPAVDFIREMATHGIIVGRSWEAAPTNSRITVGSAEEMAQFKTAFALVEAGTLGDWTPERLAFDPRMPVDEFLLGHPQRRFA